MSGPILGRCPTCNRVVGTRAPKSGNGAARTIAEHAWPTSRCKGTGAAVKALKGLEALSDRTTEQKKAAGRRGGIMAKTRANARALARRHPDLHFDSQGRIVFASARARRVRALSS